MTTSSIDDLTNLDVLSQLELVYKLTGYFDGRIEFKHVLSDLEFIYLLIFLIENEFMYLLQRRTATIYHKSKSLHILNQCLEQKYYFELSQYHLNYGLGGNLYNIKLHVPKKDRTHSVVLNDLNTILNEVYFYCTGKPYDPLSFPHIPRRNPKN